MAKRLKYVHSFDMVCHLWAHQSQNSARTSGRQLYFDGDTIYSYGSHFPIARHIKHRGKTAVLFTTRDYSSTTTGHKHVVFSACQHLTVFYVADIHASHKEHLADYRKRLSNLMGQYAKARSRKPEIFGLMESLVQQANAYAEFFNLKTRLTLPLNTEETVAECNRITALEIEARRKREARKEKEREEELKKAEEDLQKWISGESNSLPYNAYYLPVRLRIKEDELQTSKGAQIPLDHAIKAFRIIKRLYDKGETYKRNGHTIHLGNFPLDEIDKEGNVTAGCHIISRSEVERIAAVATVAGIL